MSVNGGPRPSVLSPIYPPMRTALLLSTLALALAAPAQAQSAFMPYLGYDTETENLLIGVGARFGAPLDLPVALTIQPGIEYQFQDGGTLLQFDANVIGELNAGPSLAPYLGAGLGVFYVNPEDVGGVDLDSETEFGLNLLGGLTFNPTGFGRPFVQGRYSTRGDFSDSFTVMGGVMLGL